MYIVYAVIEVHYVIMKIVIWNKSDSDAININNTIIAKVMLLKGIEIFWFNVFHLLTYICLICFFICLFIYLFFCLFIYIFIYLLAFFISGILQKKELPLFFLMQSELMDYSLWTTDVVTKVLSRKLLYLLHNIFMSVLVTDNDKKIIHS